MCKPWRRALTSRENAHLWKTIELNKPIARRYPPNSHNLNKLFSYSGNDVRRLIIKDAAALRLNNSKIQSLLRRSRQLQYLEFHNELEPLSVDVHQWPPTLTHVVINEGHVPGTLWQALAENIQHLHINPKAPNSAAPQLQLPVLPKLRYLHIDGTLGMLRPVRNHPQHKTPKEHHD